MKLSSTARLGLLGATACLILGRVQAARGSSAGETDFWQTLQQRNHVRHLKSDSDDGAGGAGGAGGVAGDVVDGTAPLLDDQCYICTKEIDGIVQATGDRPTQITAQYIGGQGVISRYQDDSKATCRDQVFPESGVVTIEEYEWSQNLTTGDIFTFSNPGGEMSANTIFTFSNGISCSIHTSCSQPLTGGDQLGPFLLLEGNDCKFPFCGDGVKDEGEECDDGDAMPTVNCRNCTIPICGDGIVDEMLFEACDEGDAMPTATCRNCTIPFCGDGVQDVNEACDEGSSMPTATCRNCTVPFCGDEILDIGEECDDGANGIDTDGCRDNCTIQECGDGIVDSNEECDDGKNGDDTDGCRDDCTIPRCGDNRLDPGEECDDGANGDDTDGCRDNCTEPICGDMIVDTFLDEECDDGKNGDDTDGCRDDCTIPRCGDNRLDPGEECDDGANGDDTDGCRDNCTEPICGDMIVDTFLDEECDDGKNGDDTDGCRDDCTIPRCGDNRLDPGEECDDGANGDDTDGCRDNCTEPICGDMILDVFLGEQCDDGKNGDDTDGCRDDCTKPNCGDGILDPGEECDGTENCRIDCTLPFCGDFVLDLDLGEECDEGDLMPTANCRNCTLVECGDSVVDVGEECDDGRNGDDTDGCRDDCTIPFCGDGRLDTILGEECDDGANGNMTDGCRDDCTIPFCGDGILDFGEECDEGADNGILVNGGCKADCTVCSCEAVPTYDANSGTLTIDFDMCGQEPLESDFIGIYPCDAVTRIADEDWWNDTVCDQFPGSCAVPFDYGYVEGQEYAAELYTWFSWTCGSPLEPFAGGCQADNSTVWPSSGTVVLDPDPNVTDWAFLGGRTLEPGCYKVILNREMKFISPPPYPTICEPWNSSLTFEVPASSGTNVNPLEAGSSNSGSRTFFSAMFVAFISFLALYLNNK